MAEARERLGRRMFRDVSECSKFEGHPMKCINKVPENPLDQLEFCHPVFKPHRRNPHVL